MPFKKVIFILLSATLISGCQSYTQENEKIRKDLYSGKLQDANKQLDESS